MWNERKPEQIAEEIGRLLDTLRERRPLVHNITNYVVMNSTANALLALGASPVMAHAVEEVEEMAALSGALVINIGTLSTPWIEAMFRAGRAARARGIPIVLDPVGAGATRLRTETARRLLEDLRPAVVRGNASEILALGGAEAGARGVDAAHTVNQGRETGRALAQAHGIVVAVTGPEDCVTDGRREARVNNGHPLLGRVTGTGCIATALTAAFCAVEPQPFRATTAALVALGVAGELAARRASRPGSYAVALLDALDELAPADLTAHARLTIEDLSI